jgi:glutamate-5-semialdehyde dehydrogenase
MLADEGQADPQVMRHFIDATEEDWGREYLGLEISVKVISGGVEEAIAHINKYGTGHSECVITKTPQVAERFQKLVDAAAVYVNGLGAEIGISTQKLHVRGPFALDALTSSKYLIDGDGQVRS